MNCLAQARREERPKYSPIPSRNTIYAMLDTLPARYCQALTLCPTACRQRSRVLSCDPWKDVINIVVGRQSYIFQRARLNAFDDLLTGEVEDRLQNLRALLLICLSHRKEH